jgi:hypothetical protein
MWMIYVSWGLLFLSYFVAKYGRNHFTRLSKIPFLLVMAGAWIGEVVIFSAVAPLFMA